MSEATMQNLNYTIPSDNRELQQLRTGRRGSDDYTIPSDNRELQLTKLYMSGGNDYTIPSDNRELQQSVIVCFWA